MSTGANHDERARRIEEMYARDAQVAAARPDEALSVATRRRGLRLLEVVDIVMHGYADRPALGQRSVQLATDPESGRTSVELVPRFETISYRDLWNRAGAIAAALVNQPVRPGDRVCILGFTSMDNATIDVALIRLSAVSVPLQAGAPVAQLRPIVAETEPTVIATDIDYLADAVELALTGHTPEQLVVLDYRPEVDDNREAVETARTRLTGATRPVTVETLVDVVARGERFPAESSPLSATQDDSLALLIYTSGSTGMPKGAMYPQRLVANLWRASREWFGLPTAPAITLSFMPMSHVLGQHIVYGTLGRGGTVYFAAKNDRSTLLEDLALVRPTELNFVPRVWELLFQAFQSELSRRRVEGTDQAVLEAEVTARLRRDLLGERFISAGTSSAPIPDELRAWVESFLNIHLLEGYGSTEDGAVLLDGRIHRPPLRDYKLTDVPDLGYFHTDRPHPRGELLVRSDEMFSGYYHRPDATAEVFDSDGFYRTGDIMAEIAPGHLAYVDRRNNVLKLAQGEFVAVSKLEAVFGDSPLIDQIYIYGNSSRPYLLAVIVPTRDTLSNYRADELKPLISTSLRDIGKAAGLASYEIPRDCIIEDTPFTLENNLLTGIGKIARPKLKARYGPQLEQLYTDLAEDQANDLRQLRRNGANRPVLDTVGRAASALLSVAPGDLRPDTRFMDLGGDSLSAVSFAKLLNEIFGIDVSVGIIVSPATDLQALADYIATRRTSGTEQPTVAAVHGRDATELSARDLTLDKFIDDATLETARTLPRPSTHVRTVLLTGATGFLGRFLALEWLERLSLVGGTLICLVRAKDEAAARNRLDKIFNSGDPKLSAHYRKLAADHLDIVVGDKGEPNLGLDQRSRQRLADTVDVIVDAAAQVNHVLPYSRLFVPNVVGTAELIRLALTSKMKSYTYVSTVGVLLSEVSPVPDEDIDVRIFSPTRSLDDSYANGYNNSKWASEVLLREANDLCDLPVTVFRCDMIMADTKYEGQINAADMFSRLMLSLLATGVAPVSFYELDPEGNRSRAHYDGLPVDFIAEAITGLGASALTGAETYHVLNPHEDGIGLDEYVDWLIDAGYRIERIPEYPQWLQRFETAMRALSEYQRRYSLLPLLHNWQQPQKPLNGALAPTQRFRTAVQEAKIGPDKDIPHVTPTIIAKYITGLEQLELL